MLLPPLMAWAVPPSFRLGKRPARLVSTPCNTFMAGLRMLALFRKCPCLTWVPKGKRQEQYSALRNTTRLEEPPQLLTEAEVRLPISTHRKTCSRLWGQNRPVKIRSKSSLNTMLSDDSNPSAKSPASLA